MSARPKTCLTPEEYLAAERRNEYKSEYTDGETSPVDLQEGGLS